MWCGEDSIPKPPQFIKLQSDIVNKSLNNVSISQEEIKSLISASLGSGWIRLHPDSLEDIPEAPGAWLIQIENAGHAGMSQYPDKINKILQTFLSTTA